MTCKHTSIPELIAEYGSMKLVHRVTGFSEISIAKYRFDKACESHIIVNGRLFTARSTSKKADI